MSQLIHSEFSYCIVQGWGTLRILFYFLISIDFQLVNRPKQTMLTCRQCLRTAKAHAVNHYDDPELDYP